MISVECACVQYVYSATSEPHLSRAFWEARLCVSSLGYAQQGRKHQSATFFSLTTMFSTSHRTAWTNAQIAEVFILVIQGCTLFSDVLRNAFRHATCMLRGLELILRVIIGTRPRAWGIGENWLFARAWGVDGDLWARAGEVCSSEKWTGAVRESADWELRKHSCDQELSLWKMIDMLIFTGLGDSLVV